MLVNNTPLEDHRAEYGLWVKREDLCCPPPGPPFSKTRGVFAHIRNRPERVIGVLDTHHSQAGHAVAQACALLGKQCVNFYPVRKAEQGVGLKPQQAAALELGADLCHLPAGRSAILYHQAKKRLAELYQNDGTTYMMPNALKLPEMVTETAAEVARTLEAHPDIPEDIPVLIAISSGTIAAGVIKGFTDAGRWGSPFILHMGYDRSEDAVGNYIQSTSGVDLDEVDCTLVNEGYSYGDKALPGLLPPWSSNPYYDLKAFQWWLTDGRRTWGEALLWNIG